MSLDKIKRLYNLHEDNGYLKNELTELETRLKINLPLILKDYYLSLGKNKTINYSHNRLLNPNKEVRISDDGYLIFYEENQAVVSWGIKNVDLKKKNPPVWGNYGTEESPDWHMETKTTEDFLLLMAVYNGTLGGLKYNANSFGAIPIETVDTIKNNWKQIIDISQERQKVYTNNFEEVISLSFNEKGNCSAIFIGTISENRFDALLDSLAVDWSYISDEDE